ncbi:MAG: DNA repair protein RecO [Acidimicrobiia bacterium]|nr:DNA repair protein RecO [Acidimicrobiia bacterium]
MSLYVDEGIVLRTIKLGEADRIVTILTQGAGKVRAVAKGVRKTTSKFGARLEPTSRVAVQCYRGRDLDVVTQVETLDSNRALREDYTLLTHAVPMLEAVDQLAPEREPNPVLYRMLSGALRTLAERRAPLVAPAFFWKVLSAEGFRPILDSCARCGADASTGAELVAIDLEEGGTLCGPCARAGGMRVSPDALALLRRVIGGGLNAALAEPACRAVDELEHLGVAALEHHLERRLRSAALL